jgi:hypothetical protein
MTHPSEHLGVRRLSARIESRHSISSGNRQALYRVELTNVKDEANGVVIWRRKTVSDGKKWSDVPTGSEVYFDAKLEFDRNNQVQIFNIKNVEVAPPDGSPWWKLW